MRNSRCKKIACFLHSLFKTCQAETRQGWTRLSPALGKVGSQSHRWMPENGQRCQGRPKKRWWDDSDAYFRNWADTTRNRELWRSRGEAFCPAVGKNSRQKENVCRFIFNKLVTRERDCVIRGPMVRKPIMSLAVPRGCLKFNVFASRWVAVCNKFLRFCEGLEERLSSVNYYCLLYY